MHPLLIYGLGVLTGILLVPVLIYLLMVCDYLRSGSRRERKW